MFPELAIPIATCTAIAALVFTKIFIIQQDESIVVQKLGKFSRTLAPGLSVLLPIIESPRRFSWKFREAEQDTLHQLEGFRVPMRNLRYDPIPLNCTTSDNIPVEVDLVIQFKITDAEKAVYNTSNLFADLEDVVQTKLYEAVRAKTSLELSTNELSAALPPAMFVESLASFGCAIVRVGIQEIIFPEEIRQATVDISSERRKQQAELEKLDNEAKTRIKMAEAKLEEQRKDQELERENETHRLDMVKLSATTENEMAMRKQEHALEVERLKAEQSLKLTREKQELELGFLSKKQELALESLRRETESITASPAAIPYWQSKHQADAIGSLSGSGTKLVVASNSALEFAARAPLVMSTTQN